MRIPAAMPENMSTGRYTNIFRFETRVEATRSCPMLWATPPAMETPVMEKRPVLFKSHITVRLTTPPAREYSAPKRPLNRSPATRMRITLIPMAYRKFIL